MKKTVKRIKMSSEDRIFYGFVYTFLILILIIIGYPLIFMLSASFSSAEAVSAGRVFLWPVDISLMGYTAIFETGDVLLGYRNSLFYAVFGTLINLFITLIAAYPLSRRDLPGKGPLMFLFTFTMIFSGGMIPSYLLVNELGLMNTIWALLLPGALSVMNMIITRTFFQNSIPHELLEAAQIDGCNDFRFFLQIALPLSKAVIAVITLYYAIAHWNSYFSAFLYITKKELYPLQIFLRNILIANTFDPAMLLDQDTMEAKQGLANLMKYSLIVVATVPVLIVYPFVQKHFVKGVMIGSIKG